MENLENLLKYITVEKWDLWLLCKIYRICGKQISECKLATLLRLSFGIFEDIE